MILSTYIKVFYIFTIPDKAVYKFLVLKIVIIFKKNNARIIIQAAHSKTNNRMSRLLT